MEKKYIIKLEENEIAYKTVDSNGMPMIQLLEPTPHTEPDIEKVRDETYTAGYKAGREAEKVRHPDLWHAKTEGFNIGYNHGLSDAWKCARKIWEYDITTLKEIFGKAMRMDCYTKFTASEAIEKIRQYEQEKEEEIQVGDEVIAVSGKAVVTAVGPVYFEYVYADGSIGSDKVENAKKSGRHFHEIAEVLAKMKEGE